VNWILGKEPAARENENSVINISLLLYISVQRRHAVQLLLNGHLGDRGDWSW